MMSVRHRLKTRLSVTIALVALFIVLTISFLSNIFLNRHFSSYKTSQLEYETAGIINSLRLQYSNATGIWDENFVHTIGMQALQNGYILTVKDQAGNIVWDAETCDMTSCQKLVSDMTSQMKERRPGLSGGFITRNFDITLASEKIGTVVFQYYSPYFLSENDADFINGLNKILFFIGVASLLISILIGSWVAKKLSAPLQKAVFMTQQIALGDYPVRMSEKTSTIEILDLMESVNLLASTLEKQESLRKQLTADVAHELRTPLTTLQTHLEAMLEGVWEPTPARLESCHDEVVRIGRIVLDLESLARTESGNVFLTPETIHLRDIIQKAITGFEGEIKKKNLHVTLDGDCPDIMADRDRIHQVITNLLSNAVKYTQEGGSVSFLLSASSSGQDAVIRVKDNGIGILPEDIPFIFERFYRADKSRNRMTGGSGIGLAIVRSIVDAHGGEITVASKAGEGTEFVLKLPVTIKPLA